MYTGSQGIREVTHSERLFSATVFHGLLLGAWRSSCTAPACHYTLYSAAGSASSAHHPKQRWPAQNYTGIAIPCTVST